MNKSIILIFFAFASLLSYGQSIQGISVKNDASMSRRRGYYNWKIYLVAHPDTLLKIKEVVYTLHQTFKYPVQKVKASTRNKNFSYSASGWGEFEVKVKIVYRVTGRRSLYLSHHLNFDKRG